MVTEEVVPLQSEEFDQSSTPGCWEIWPFCSKIAPHNNKKEIDLSHRFNFIQVSSLALLPHTPERRLAVTPKTIICA